MNRWMLLTAALLLAGLSRAATDDIVVADFEGKDWGEWKAEGNSFGPGPAHGTLPGQMDVSGYKGKGLVNSFVGGDDSQGTLTSPPFKLERPILKFLIGGGGYAGTTCLELLLDGKVVRSATGPNTRPGGSERLAWSYWDVSEWAGQMVQLRVADRAKGGWGHVNVDQIVQTRTTPEPAAMKFVVATTYLHMPVKNGAEKRTVEMWVNGKQVRAFEVELGKPDACDWWASYDIGAYRGFELTLKCGALDDEGKLGDLLGVGDQRKGMEGVYHEEFRPQFHLTPQRGWNNDPNGMVYADGQWHVFFQQNPFGNGWGNMHWGHWISADLVHWRELPTALYPHSPGDAVFSGGAVLDEANTAGFAIPGQSAIVASYTSTGRGECLAYSLDGGCTFIDYPGNPIYKHSGRDPKIVWYEPTKKWILIVYDEGHGGKRYELHESSDLKTWTPLTSIDGLFECPEFFPLNLDGDPAKTKWLVDGHAWREKDGRGWGTHNSYKVGTFDGKTYTGETEVIDGHLGPCFYAAQTFSHAPDGRRIMIGWLNGGNYPGMPFSQGMTVPLELSLKTTPEGPRLHYYPVKELTTLRGPGQEGKDLDAAGATQLLGRSPAPLLDVETELEPGGADLTLTLRNIPIAWHAADQTLHFRGVSMPCPLIDGRLKLRVLVDCGVVEVFAQDGLAALAAANGVCSEQKANSTLAGGPALKVARLAVWELAGIWP